MKEFEELWATLETRRDVLGLVVGDGADRLVRAAASWRGLTPISVGYLLTVENPNEWQRPDRLLRGHQVLTDIEVLFWPTVLIDPMRLLRLLSRRGPVIVQWPGQVTADRRAVFSEPGRLDYYNEPLGAEVVVRSRPITSVPGRTYDLEIAQ